MNQDIKLYKGFAIAVVACFFLVIAAGSIVRATGSGLGCPDWPKCFGQYIPPLSESELPTDYQNIYKIQGKSIAKFSAFKTWTEYINRLLGAVAGFLVLGLMITGIRHKKHSHVDSKGSIALFFMIGFQGWLGSVVVSSHLKPYIITLHMALAMVVTCLAVDLLRKAYDFKILIPKNLNQVQEKIRFNILVIFLLSTIQLILGTRVREQVDHWMHNPEILDRNLWFENLGSLIDFHRGLAVLIITAVIVFIRNLKKFPDLTTNQTLMKLSYLPLICLFLSYLSGISFKHLGFPAWNQPVHLLLGTMLLTITFFNWRSIQFNND